MEALDLLLNRESALKLEAPGPDQTALDRIFQAAVRSPDHGRLRPWRFVVIPEDRRAAFGEVMADSMRRKEPQAGEETLQRERDKAMRAPVIVVVAAHTVKEHKIPEIEQFISAATAAQTVVLAANAQGFGAMWKTGGPAYDPEVKRALGLDAEDQIIGFLYLGTRTGGSMSAARPKPGDYVSVWHGRR
jgi:nitroreductase